MAFIALRQLKVQTKNGVEPRRRGDKILPEEINNNPHNLLRNNFICHEHEAEQKLAVTSDRKPPIPVDPQGRPIEDLEAYKAGARPVAKVETLAEEAPAPKKKKRGRPPKKKPVEAAPEYDPADRVDLGEAGSIMDRVKASAEDK